MYHAEQPVTVDSSFKAEIADGWLLIVIVVVGIGSLGYWLPDR